MRSQSRTQNRHKLDLRGRRLLVVGLAREGTALAGYLIRQGAQVVATDLKAAHTFGDALKPLSEAGVELVLGKHPTTLLDDCELIFVSPGVPFDAAFLDQARARGIPLSTESRLFCQLCPAPIAAITGSSGKTTTTTLVGEILKAGNQAQGGGRGIWVGGNIGQPLIEHLDRVRPDDQVVMELSSFQLEYFHPSANEHVHDADPMWLPLLAGWSPAVAAILNITPNHLDRHPSMQAYIHAKRAIMAYRQPGAVAVMNYDNDVTRILGQSAGGRVRWFSAESTACQQPPLGDGACLSGPGPEAAILVRHPSPPVEQSVCRLSQVRLRGQHNVSNVLAACLIADCLGASAGAMHQAVTSFSGVAHRLEPVAEVRGVRYFNDSIATSPERLVAALKSFDEPIVLLAGGRDKHLPWDEAARLMLLRARHVILFGEATELIAGALEAASEQLAAEGGAPRHETQPMLHRCVRLEDAVAVGAQVAHAGDVVLLAPGCTSFDAYRDFEERGDRFRELVEGLAVDEVRERD
jgi:UDP-N-acetylmuramoylalanine--D-glutamate ligase